jgi:Phasin protein
LIGSSVQIIDGRFDLLFRAGHFTIRMREDAMVAKEQRTSAKPAVPNLDPAQFVEMGQRQVDAMIKMQKELMKAIEEANSEWAVRVKAETELTTEFAGKLTAARSIPEMATICQEWISRRMEIFADDSRRFVADSQKFMATTARLLSSGGPGGST